MEFVDVRMTGLKDALTHTVKMAEGRPAWHEVTNWLGSLNAVGILLPDGDRTRSLCKGGVYFDDIM